MEEVAKDLNNINSKKSPTINMLKSIAQQYSMYIVAGMIEKPDKVNGKPFNIAIFINK